MRQGSAEADAPVFKSAVDRWLAVLLFGLVLGTPVLVIVATIMNWPGWGEAAGSFVLMLIGPAIVVALVVPLRYSLTRETLIIRAGLVLRWTVPLAGIVAIEPTRSPLSSPALSLRRLRIAYHTASGGRRAVMISPQERDAFLDGIVARTDHLRREGDRLVSAESA